MPDLVPSVVEVAPLRSEGIDSVGLVTFNTDAMTVHAAGQSRVFRYVDIAAWPFPAPCRRTLWKLGWRRTQAAIGERHWHTDHQQARIEFFTRPRLTIWMPAEGHLPYGTSPWVQIQRRLGTSGFYTWDMT